MSPNFKLPLFLRLVAAIGFVFLLTFAYSAFFILQNATFDNKTPSDVIIVLGSRTHSDTQNFNPCLLSRVQHGVDLHKRGFAPKIILSGGFNPDDGFVEADEMKKIALSKGVKDSDIFVENKSTSTYENLVNSQKIMNQNQMKTSIIVNEAYQMPRDNLIAQKLKMVHSVSPTTNTPCWNSGIAHINFFLFRDTAALIQYVIQSRI